jgi:hypothetical protein
MIVMTTEKCVICGKEVYGIMQSLRFCTKCHAFVCTACEKKGCPCGNRHFESQFEYYEKRGITVRF